MKQDITPAQFIDELLAMGLTVEQAERLLLITDTREGWPCPREAMIDLVGRVQIVLGGAAAKG